MAQQQQQLSEVKLVNKGSPVYYFLDPHRVNMKTLTSLFGQPVAFLEANNHPIFPDSQGIFEIVPGGIYNCVLQTTPEEGRASLKSSRDLISTVDLRGEVLSLFRRFDTDKSGTIDHEEFKKLIAEMGGGRTKLRTVRAS